MEKLEAQIEELVNKHGLVAVTDALVLVCYDKAAHILVSYGDEKLAAQWRKAGASLVNPREEVEFPS